MTVPEGDCRTEAVVLSHSPHPGGMMSNDPLPLLDMATGPANDADYEAVYAKIMASEGGRRFLAEYLNRNRSHDTQTLLDTIARLEAATRENASVPAALACGLVDLAAAIKQVEAVLARGGGSASDDLFAAERIQDIAMALRNREIEAALCDALEVSAREVGDSIVRNNAAAARVASVASLLRDLARRANELIALVAAAARPMAEQDNGLTEIEVRRDHSAGRLDVTAQATGSDDVGAQSFADEPVDSLVQSGCGHASPPELQALSEQKEDADNWFKPLQPASTLQLTEARQDAARTESAAAIQVFSSQAFSTEPSVSGFSAPSPMEAKIEEKSPAAPVSAEPRSNESPAARTISRTTPSDPLAAVLALSEEELIALFS